MLTFFKGLTWRRTRWIPHLLTDAQKQRRVEVVTSFLERQQREPFLQNVVTMDETWLPYNNPNPRNAWLHENQPAPLTTVPDFWQRKIMLSVFWCQYGVIYWYV